MFGKFISDAYSKVRNKADDLRQQVAQQASKAGEALGFYKSYSERSLQYQLLSQATQISNQYTLEEVCRRWCLQIKESKKTIKSNRYVVDGDATEKKLNIPPREKGISSRKDVAIPSSNYRSHFDVNQKSHENSQSNTGFINDISSSHVDISSIPAAVEKDSSTIASFEKLTETKKLSEEFPQISKTETDLNSALVADAPSYFVDQPSNISTNDCSLGATGIHGDADIFLSPLQGDTYPIPLIGDTDSSHIHIFSLTFKQVFLRSKALESLLRCVFTNRELQTGLIGPLHPESFFDDASSNEIHVSACKELLELFGECLWGERKLHREILTLFLIVDASWELHIDWLIQLVSAMKYDWEDDFLLDNRRIIANEIAEIQAKLDKQSSSIDSTAMKKYDEKKLNTDNAKHGVRILGSRRILAYYKHLQQNVLYTVKRREKWFSLNVKKIEELKELLESKNKAYDVGMDSTNIRKQEMEDELMKCSDKLRVLLSESDERIKKVDIKIEELRVERITAMKVLEKLNSEIEELEGKRRSILAENSDITNNLMNLQESFEKTIATEEETHKSNNQQKIDTQNILRLTTQSREILSKMPYSNGMGLLDKHKTLADIILILTRRHILYELDRLHHQQASLFYYYETYVRFHTEYKAKKHAAKGNTQRKSSHIAGESSILSPSPSTQNLVGTPQLHYSISSSNEGDISHEYLSSQSPTLSMHNENVQKSSKNMKVAESSHSIKYFKMVSRKNFIHALEQLDLIWHDFLTYKKSFMEVISYEDSRNNKSSLECDTDKCKTADNVELKGSNEETMEIKPLETTHIKKVYENSLDDEIINVLQSSCGMILFNESNENSKQSLRALLESFEDTYQSIRRLVAPLMEQITKSTSTHTNANEIMLPDHYTDTPENTKKTTNFLEEIGRKDKEFLEEGESLEKMELSFSEIDTLGKILSGKNDPSHSGNEKREISEDTVVSTLID